MVRTVERMIEVRGIKDVGARYWGGCTYASSSVEKTHVTGVLVQESTTKWGNDDTNEGHPLARGSR